MESNSNLMKYAAPNLYSLFKYPFYANNEEVK
jgi:hypothetical protein